ncbi:DUF2460 domain-containing protein [Sphingomicrobium sp. XHP0239]|uniref:DUF2460 domain-containing protein n=1 Tax=Sphingomicrobium maritimum TaxID=3133972 RepID=UPI0031CC6271
MGGFVDEYLPDAVPGYPCVSSPRTKTTIVSTHGGREQRNQEWEHPLYRFTLPRGVREWSEVAALRDHWLAMRGPLHSWPWVDPLDFTSRELTAPNPDYDPPIGATDQAIGTGTGFTDKYQLVKRYVRGAQTYVRPIHLPVVSTVTVAVDGDVVDPADFSVSREGGVVSLAEPPGNGLAVTAGFFFDVEVRFEDDDVFEGILQTWQAGGFADLSFIEVRPC